MGTKTFRKIIRGFAAFLLPATPLLQHSNTPIASSSEIRSKLPVTSQSKHPRALLIALLCGCLAGCLPTGAPPGKKQNDEKLIFSEAQKALDAHDYPDAIDLLQIFLDRFPESDRVSWALQRMGEGLEGLLATEYRRRVESGEPEPEVRRQFLQKHGKLDRWLETPDGLAYSGTHYRMILEKHPDSPIADEAAYRLIPWVSDYRGLPAGPLSELEHLEAVLEKYPGTSFRYEILYKMAYRCHILYEMYSFSSRPGVSDRQKADRFRAKALYLYKMALKSPDQTKYSQKAWAGLKALEDGRRIYRPL